MRAARDEGRDGAGGCCVRAGSSGLCRQLSAKPEGAGGHVAYGDALCGGLGLVGLGFNQVF